MRLDWETVGRIISRVVDKASRNHDRLDGLRRIGIDEISWRTGQRYLTLVIDHTSGRLVWAAEGRSRKVVDSFFELLGHERCAQLTHVSSDGAEWILIPVEQHCPNATICLDPFHVVQWATRCRIGPFVALARTIAYYRADIEATLLHGVNNGRVESLNTKVRLIARRAFGFHSAHALIALSELTLGGLCPSLPGRHPW